jgi:glucose/mannose-6-phosphate isomerase
MTDLTREAIGALDSGSVIEDALAMPHQMGDALWRADSAGIDRADRPLGLVVCGMGGSAVGGDLAAAAIGARAERPIVTSRGYAPPSWVGPGCLVLCSSYSGNTEETLASFEAAGAAGAPRVALTTGGKLAEAAREAGVPVIGVPSGMQPRSAVAYVTVGTLVCAELAGVTPSLRGEIEAAGALLESLCAEWGPDAGDSEATQLARAIGSSVALVYGAGPTAAPAGRWKTQINENAKAAAFRSELPEADHNEICAYGHNSAQVHAVFLEQPGAPERISRRVELTAGLAADAGVPVSRVQARGESGVEQVMSLVLLGDLVSIYMAALHDVDPTPVEPIERFKRALG